MPTLLDEIKRNPTNFRLIKPKFSKIIRSSMPKARVFVFDDEASQIVGNFVKTCPDLIEKNEQFAIPLFDDMYVEFNIDEFLKILGRPQSGNDVTRDIRVGYLISSGMIFPLLKTADGQPATFSGMVYTIGRNPNMKPFEGFRLGSQLASMVSRRMKATGLLGTTIEQFSIEGFQKIAEKYEIGNALITDLEFDIIRHSNGDVRNVICLLLFLYQGGKNHSISMIANPPKRGIVRGKQITFYGYNTVSIHLKDTKQLRKHFSVTDRDSPRRHDVRPHYRTIPKRTGCDHDFKEIEEHRKWVCNKCGAMRIRVKKHMRGDSTRGYVYKNYEVVA